jgi:NTE family protein
MVGHLKIGYALGGGGARGLSHIGVLKVLEEHNIFPDVIVGTSIGAVIGALYAGGYKASDIERLALGLNWKKMMRLADITLPTGGFIQGKRVTALLQSILGDLTFSQLKCTYACATTDVITGEEVILQDGSLIEAVRASISLPGIFRPVPVKGRYLVDGGLLNEVPVSICRRLGADYVIGVNVIPAPGAICNSKTDRLAAACEVSGSGKGTGFILSGHSLASKTHLARIELAIGNFISKQTKNRGNSLKLSGPGDGVMSKLRPPTLWEVVRQSLIITQYHVAIENIKLANLAVSPEIDDIGFWQFTRAAEAIAAGERTTRIALKNSELLKSALRLKLKV